jgi:uncharacterized protein
MRLFDIVAIVLVLIGAINWGLVGCVGVNLVGWIFGPMSALTRVVYALMGLAAVYYVVEWGAMQDRWVDDLAPGEGGPALPQE